MNKLMFVLAIFSVLSFAVVANSDPWYTTHKQAYERDAARGRDVEVMRAAVPPPQAGSMAQNGVTIFDGTKLVGAMVKASDGVELGTIFDTVITSQGNVDFVIVDQVPPPNLEDPWPGHTVAVPFNALTISKGKSQELQVVFNADREKFYEAPGAPSSFFHSGGQVNLQKVAALDRYFGVQPYWTEGGQTSSPMMEHSSSGSTQFKRPVGLAPDWSRLVQ